MPDNPATRALTRAVDRAIAAGAEPIVNRPAEPERYTLGWNMPGYLPEMEPWTADTLEDARAGMLDELDRAADQAAELDGLDEQYRDMPAETATAEAIAAGIAELKAMPAADLAGGWDLYAGNLHYWITPAEEG